MLRVSVREKIKCFNLLNIFITVPIGWQVSLDLNCTAEW